MLTVVLGPNLTHDGGCVMRRLAILAVAAALLSPTTASGQNYTFGDWARDEGYTRGDAMPSQVRAVFSSIDSLDGIGDFDWTTTPATRLWLSGNQLSSIEPNAFSGLANLTNLDLEGNWLSTIELGAFSGLPNLTYLSLRDNQLSSIESSAFSGPTDMMELDLEDNQLSRLESGAFSGLVNLTLLSLGGNDLSSIEPGDFTGLTNLRGLGLWGNRLSSIEPYSFSGMPDLTWLNLEGNQLSSLDSGAFSGLTNLTTLRLTNNQVSNIESGVFGGLVNLAELSLSLAGDAALTKLNLEAADFPSLLYFHVAGNATVGRVSLKNTVLNHMSLVALFDGGEPWLTGIGELDGITEMDLSGIDFGAIIDLEPLYVMDDLTDLWLVDTQNVDAIGLDVLLDNLETIEGADAEGILYMTKADFDAFNTAGSGLLAAWDAEPGHHVEFLQIGDVNHDTEVNGLDVDPFVDVLLASRIDVAADMNGDGVVNGLDVEPFVAAVVGGAQAVPEPATLLLCSVALAVVGGWRKWGG
jgi:hypothetical protein